MSLYLYKTLIFSKIFGTQKKSNILEYTSKFVIQPNDIIITNLTQYLFILLYYITMQKEATYRNHYKTQPNLKNTIIFFHIGCFYKTFESDAMLMSQLFGFKINIQDGASSIGFSDSSENYLDRLQDAGYAYIVLQLQKNGNISILGSSQGHKSLDISIPFETFQGLLDDILHLYERYSTTMRLVQPIDLPIDIDNEKGIMPNKIKDITFNNGSIPNIGIKNSIQSSLPF